MTVTDITALIGGVTALVVAITTAVVTIFTTLKQNRLLADAAVKREDCAAKLEDVHAAVTGVPSKGKDATDPAPPPA